MEESLWDGVVDELLERQRLLRTELQERFKKTKPFRMKEMSSDEALEQYDMITPEKMNELVATHGEDEVNQMIMEMEQLKGKKNA